VLCAVQNETIGYVVVWQLVLEWRVCCVLCRIDSYHITYKDIILPSAFNQAQYKLPDDGRRPKDVGAKFCEF
jgi:hypothetical protein